jgi:MFS family permease
MQLASGLRTQVAAVLGGLPAVFWTAWWGLVINRMCSFVVAFLAIYLVHERGFSTGDAGHVLALYGVGMIVAGPLGGLLADEIGRRSTMILGLVLGAAAVSALAFAHAPIALAVFAFASAAAGEIYRPAFQATIADVVPPRDRTRAFGLVYWAVNMALSVGLVIGGIIGERSLVALFLADAGTSLAAAGLLLARVPETRPRGLVHDPALRGLLKVFRDGPFVSFLLFHLGALVVFTQWQLALPIDMAAHGHGTPEYAVLMALNCAGVVVIQPVLAPRLARHDAGWLLAASALLFGAGFGINAIGSNFVVYAIGTALWTLGEVVGFPVATATVASLAPAELRARYQGVFGMCWGVAFTLSPLGAGDAVDWLGRRPFWLTCLGLGATVAVGHVVTAPSRRRRLSSGRSP